MPANLTPAYEKAEQRYRAAASDQERLDALREMLSVVPKHKGTEKIQADIKRRISQLRKAEARHGPAKGPDPFHVPRGGAGQVLLLGPPNVGKSLLLAVTTNAPAKVADYPFTTAVPAPGMWRYQDVQIQLVDTPPVTPEHLPGGLLGAIRAADVIAVVVDAAGQPLEQAEMVLGLLAARGLALRSAPRRELETNVQASQPAEPPPAAGTPQGEGDTAPPPAPQPRCGLIVANKAELAPPQNVATLADLYAGRLDVLAVSAASGQGLHDLLQRLWQLLAVIRVYTKEPGKPPDRDRPFTLPAGATVADLAGAIHRELPERMKFARIWGDGRFAGQQVHRTEVLHDKDVVEIHE